MNSTGSPLVIDGIHHYTISVADIGRSLKWYRGKLGFELSSRTSSRNMGKSAWLRNGAVDLQLIQVSKPNPLPAYRSHPDTDNAVQGYKHFSLRIIDGPKTERELRALGANIVFVPVFGESHGIFICDPTGNLIEILQETRPSCPSNPAQMPGKQPIAIEGWSHIAISVPDTGASVEWYERVLGFPVAHSDSITSPGGHTFKITWLQGPGFSIELFEVPGSARIPEERLYPATDIKTLGNKYLSLAVENLERAREKLKALGAEVIPSSDKDRAGLFTRDISGNLIELCRSLPERH